MTIEFHHVSNYLTYIVRHLIFLKKYSIVNNTDLNILYINLRLHLCFLGSKVHYYILSRVPLAYAFLIIVKLEETKSFLHRG